jgi:glucose/arabinose dehydrogenase
MVSPPYKSTKKGRTLFYRLISLSFVVFILCLGTFTFCKNKLFQGSDREVWNNSRLTGSPDPTLPYEVQRAFPKLSLKHPVALKQDPVTGNMLVLETDQTGERHSRLKRFVADEGVRAAETMLELPGLAYSIEFHPQYEQNGFIYLGLNNPGPDGENYSKIVRYTIDIQGSKQLVASSAFIIIQWQSDGHNGAAMCFGIDGMLYVTSGDGTSLMDLDIVGQDLTTLLSKVMRIDVDGVGPNQGYQIPQDNPFVGMPTVRPETWAYGLRNPWRITADPESGQIWVGQNGQDLREYAHLLERGANYGWSAYEGSREFLKDRLAGPSPFTPPTIEHDHSEFRSLTGGIVYRGSRFPDLVGAYIYGDYTTGRIWAARHNGNKLLWNHELADTTLTITDFTTTAAGDTLIVDYTGDAIYRLEPSIPKENETNTFPRQLSETGLFVSTPELIAAEGVLPYQINAPSWHDGAESKLLLALPKQATATFPSSNSATVHWLSWDLPDGTALAQTLMEPESGRRLETRILLKQDNDWRAYSYVWNEEQSDADLAPKEGTRIQTKDREWLVPSRAECLVCHSRQARFALSLTNPQLNRAELIQGKLVNQLASIIRQGYVKDSNSETAISSKPPSNIPPLVDPYQASAPLPDRVQAYFAVNCSHCHTPNGGGNSKLNLGPWANPEEQHLVDAPPEHEDFGLSDARLIAPGFPERSVLPIRVTLRGPGQMPPIGTLYPDTKGIQLLMEWQHYLATMESNE